MEVEAQEDEAESAGSLPIEPHTFVVRLLKRWPMVAIGMAISVVAAGALSPTVGKQTFESQTILVFRPAKTAEEDTPLLTLMKLVKTPEVIEVVREKLKIKSTISEIASAFTVDVERNTELLTIKATANNPMEAKKMAQTLRDAFLEKQITQRRQKITRAAEDLEKRQAQVSKELKAAEGKLQKFTVDNRVVDLDKEAQWYLQQLTSLQILYEQAKVERSSVKLQASNIDRIVGDLKVRIEQEKSQMSTMDNLGDTNIRAQRLRDLIHDDTTHRSGVAQLKEKQIEYDRARKLRAKGLISQGDLEKAQAAFESQQALTVDTPQVKEWKQQLAIYNAKAIPKGEVVPPSGTVLQSMTLRGFDIQLQLVTQDQKVQKLEEALASCQKRLDSLPVLQRQFASLKRDVENLAQEKGRLEGLGAAKKSNLASNLSDFTIATDAMLPIAPTKSNRKIIFLAVAAVGFIISFLAALAKAALDNRPRSGKELAQRCQLAYVAALPVLVPPATLTSFPSTKLRLELLLRFLEHQGPALHPRWLMATASPQADSFLLTSALAHLLQPSLSRVLIVQLQDSPQAPPRQKDGVIQWRQAILTETQVDILPLGEALAASLPPPAQRALLEELERDYNAVLILAPPLENSTLADTWGACCHHVVFLANSGGLPFGRLELALKRLRGCCKGKVVGILSGIEKAFQGVDQP